MHIFINKGLLFKGMKLFLENFLPKIFIVTAVLTYIDCAMFIKISVNSRVIVKVPFLEHHNF